MVLEACPDIVDYAKGGISNWRDLPGVAAVVRSMLGISPSAWEAAQSVMGEIPAAIVVAAILQRGAAITSAGGYLARTDAKGRGGRIHARADADGADFGARNAKRRGRSRDGAPGEAQRPFLPFEGLPARERFERKCGEIIAPWIEDSGSTVLASPSVARNQIEVRLDRRCRKQGVDDGRRDDPFRVSHARKWPPSDGRRGR